MRPLRGVPVRLFAEMEAKLHLFSLLPELIDDTGSEVPYRDILQRMIDAVCAVLEWPVGHAYAISHDHVETLVSSDIWHLKDLQKFEAFKRTSEITPFRIGEGLPGKVFETRRPVWITDLPADPLFLRSAVAQEVHLKSGFAFPILSGRRVFAVLEFFSDKWAEPDSSVLYIAAKAGTQLGRIFQLQESERRFRTLVEGANEGVWTLDEESRTTFLNRKASEIIGYSSEEALGKKLADFVPSEDASIVRDAMTKRRGGMRQQYDLRMIRKDGTIVWTSISATPLYDPDGRNVGSMGLVSDITERKLAEERLRQEVQIRDDFLSIASHELKTPLTALALQLGLLKRIADNAEPKVRRMIDASERQTRKLGSMLEQLLDLTRIRAGTFQLERSFVDLSALVTEVMDRSRAEAAEAGSALHWEMPEPIVGFLDPLRTEQVVLNLVSNAIKYGRGRPIDVSLKKDPATGSAILTVHDQGIGISPQDRPRLFERFSRAPGVRNIKGLGLGLYIVRQIIEAQNGTIEVESEPGKGSKFIVMFPLLSIPSEGAA